MILVLLSKTSTDEYGRAVLASARVGHDVVWTVRRRVNKRAEVEESSESGRQMW
jgi:hypothetical protein